MTQVLDIEALCTQFGGGTVRVKDLRSLHLWLGTLVPPGMNVEQCSDALVAGAQWVWHGPALSAREAAPTARLRMLLDVVESAPAWGEALGRTLSTAIENGKPISFFEIGLPNDRGLMEETTDRLARRVLPNVHDPHDLGELVSRMLPGLRAAEWLGKLPPDLLNRLAALLSVSAIGKLRQGAIDAVALIVARTSALGFTREIRARSPEVEVSASPFFLLPRLCDAWVAGMGPSTAAREQISACRSCLEAVLEHLDQFGVSIDVVYRIEVIGRNLDRVVELLDVLDAAGDEAPPAAAGLLCKLASARARDRSLRDMVRTTVRLMARKIIERAGETGEHYITASRKEYWKMMASAAGGGALTAGTCVFKYLVAWSQFPLFVEGALSSVNYALSFIIMQLCGFTLATKQPSMTAAALAHALHGSRANANLDDLVTQIARITRSQLAAAIGNLGLVIPAALVFHLIHLQLTGHPFLDDKAASYTLHSLDPLHGATIYYAALTGVFLWLSSLGAGWLENWATYRRLPEAIAQKRPRAFMRKLSRWFAHHVAGFGGNISLGFLLGMMPVFGKFFGVPLEVRHVTLSTGALTLAVCSLGFGNAHGLGAAAAGIGVILILNFGVSFALALGVAMRARAVEHAGIRVLGALLRRFFRSPGEFFFPPRA